MDAKRAIFEPFLSASDIMRSLFLRRRAGWGEIFINKLLVQIIIFNYNKHQSINQSINQSFNRQELDK